MTDSIDTTAERESLTALAGHTPGPWTEITPADNLWPPRVFATGSKFVCMVDNSDDTQEQRIINARLIAAAPDLLATAHRLLDALDAERAKVAAAYEMAAGISVTGEPEISQITQYAIRNLTPSDAAEALRKIKAEAYRAGQEVMRKRCETALSTPALRDHTVVAPARIISALPIEDLPKAQR